MVPLWVAPVHQPALSHTLFILEVQKLPLMTQGCAEDSAEGLAHLPFDSAEASPERGRVGGLWEVCGILRPHLLRSAGLLCPGVPQIYLGLFHATLRFSPDRWARDAFVGWHPRLGTLLCPFSPTC